MSKHVLFVCQSCHRPEEELPENQPSDGSILLDELNSLCSQKIPSERLEIKPVECLWACDRGCVVSVSSHNKPTYLFVNLLPQESPAALLEFLQLYIKSRKGSVAWQKCPERLQSSIFAQIPPVVVE
jgi:predicted metal-binding protein